MDIVCHNCDNDVVVFPEAVCVVELSLTEQSRDGGGVCGVIRAAEHAETNTLSLRLTHSTRSIRAELNYTYKTHTHVPQQI